jgi:16S rRNA (guanine966-N2)-methyltransferase
VVDLFAGTGSLGLEALSRGAGRALFYDVDRRSLEAVDEEPRAARVRRKGQAVYGDAFEAAGRLEPADLVFVDPPYDFYVERDGRHAAADRDLLGRVLAGPEGA